MYGAHCREKRKEKREKKRVAVEEQAAERIPHIRTTRVDELGTQPPKE